MGRKIKYTGLADRRVLPKGTSFAGRLSGGIPQEVVFSRKNHFLVDSDEAGLSAEAVELLLKEPNFQDVTDQKLITPSLNEQTFLGLRARQEPEQVAPETAGASSPPSGGGSKSGSKKGGSS